MLSAPTGRKAVSTGYDRIRVTWNSVPGASGYYVYRSNSRDGAYKLIRTNSGNSSTSYTNTGLTTGKYYYYKIVAYRSSGGVKSKSASPAPVGTRPLVSAPANLTATKKSSSSIQVKWSRAEGANGYYIYMAGSSGGPYEHIRTNSRADSTSYTVGGLKSGTNYYFKVIPYRTVSGSNVRGKTAGPARAST